MLESKKYFLEDGAYSIDGILVPSGDDLVLTIGGGTHPHIGSVAVGSSHPSLKDPQKDDQTVSVLTITGHKEDQIARQAALKLAKVSGVTVTIIVGIHIDDADQGDIQRLVKNFHTLIDQITADFQQEKENR